MNRLAIVLAVATLSTPIALPTVAHASMLATAAGDAVIHQDATDLQEVQYHHYRHHWRHGRYRWHHRYYSYRRWYRGHWIYR
jgi:hypothetical protein